jgi:Tol biopolymer transport system component
VNESAPLITTTRWLQPNLADEFINEQPDAGPVRMLRTDAFGVVLGPPDVRYESSARKILFLGGSTTENNEVDEQYRFPFLAAFQLSKSTGRNFEGLNAGVRGHTSHDSLNLYLNHPSTRIREAEVVVVMHNINDRLRLTLNESYRSNFVNSSEATSIGLMDAGIGLASSSWEWARLNSNLLFLADAVIQKNRSAEGNHGIRVTERALDAHTGVASRRINQFEQSLRNLIAVIKANGQVPVLMTQPLGRPSVDQDAFNNAIRSVTKKQSVGLIDLAKAFENLSNGPSLFYDDQIHFNNFGSKWASDEIAQTLHRMLGETSKDSLQMTVGCVDLRIGEKSLLTATLHEDVLRGRYPSFDRSDKRLLFQLNHPGGSAIVILNVATGLRDEILRSSDPLGLEHPTWIDEQRVLFTERSRDDRRLMIFDLRDRTKQALIADRALQGAIANVGLDGFIYFSGYRHTDQKPPVLYALREPGGVPKPLTLPNEESWRPFASASGDLYFINNSGGLYQIHTKKPDDPVSAKRLVIPSKYEQWDPAISNDGSLLAFAQREGGNFDVHVMRLNSSDKKPIRRVSTAEDEWDPRFSQSGQYLLYAATSPFGDQIRAVCLK